MHFTSLLSTALVVLSAASSAAGLGINCRGSGMCPSFRCSAFNRWDKGCIETIAEALQSPQFNATRTWNNGEQIFCLQDARAPRVGHLCAFLQNQPEGATGREVVEAIKHLRSHGCGKCGSVPMQEGNDVKDGQLTLNYVYKTKCRGYCDQ
ncbi:MAG: hypothetical protein M1817_002515 [Caeruleum heppii]|nr:MAG: hypothetical protein M1817_002515 [Caeruleum heppii]